MLFAIAMTSAMTSASPDRELLTQLLDIPEVTLSGFTVREGLTGAGVTILKGRNYFGSWRATGDELIWSPANLSEPSHCVASVDEAVRHTLLLILQNLETGRGKPAKQALAG